MCRISGASDSGTLSRSYEAANPTACRIAVPQDILVDVETVRFRIVSGQLNLGDHSSVSGIQLVDGAIIGIDAPEDAIVPSKAMSPDARSWNTADDLAGLGFHQKKLA